MEIGADVALIKRFEGKEENFYRKFLQPSEYAEFSAFKSEKRRREYAAGRWAGKEAIFKATQDERYLEYEILGDEKGKPYVAGRPELKISISHDGEYAFAVVIKNDI